MSEDNWGEAQQAHADKVMPNNRTELVKIDNAIAVVSYGIPVSDELSEEIFDERKGPKTFDAITLDTSEVLKPSWKGGSGVSEALDDYKKYKEWHKRDPGNKMVKAFLEDAKSRATYSYYGDDSSMGKWLNPETQKKEFAYNLYGIIKRDRPEFDLLLNDLEINHDKPFLLIYGHGGAQSRMKWAGLKKETYWWIGEGKANRGTDLKKVFDYMNVSDNKYSAILLASCNGSRVSPPSAGGTPLYYVEGLAGPIQKNATKRSVS